MHPSQLMREPAVLLLDIIPVSIRRTCLGVPATLTTGRLVAFSLRRVSSISVEEPANEYTKSDNTSKVIAQEKTEALTQKAKKAEKPSNSEMTSWTVVSVAPC